jgi:MerR family transcriptional regulator, light-induced transcriptional regulator
MDLEAAAAALGVHYQTAYRLVRTGVLPAAKVGLGYTLDPEDVEALRKTRWSGRSPATDAAVSWLEEQDQFLRSLLCGRDTSARSQLQRIQGLGATPVDVCEQLVAPVIRRLDARGMAGWILPAEVRAATTLCERLVGAITAPMRGRPRGLAVVASPVSDRHRLPSLMATAALRGSRWRVQHLGSGVPARDLVEFAEETQPEIVVLSVTVWDEPAEEFCASVSSCTGVPVVAGGSGESLADLFKRVDDATRSPRLAPEVHR